MSETPPPSPIGPDPETVAFLRRLNPLFEVEVPLALPDTPPPTPASEDV